jgi:serine/threonine-protein kinase
VVHRDLKPRNIFLCGEPDARHPVPRVLDFGIARTAREADMHESTLTGSGTVVGTPQYMAPEQLLEASAEPSVDVYALGVILYECLSGQRPFHGPNYNALVVQITTTTARALHELRPDLPRGLCALVHRALARDPAARVASVAELQGELERTARGDDVATPRPERSSARYAGVAVLALGLASAVYWIAADAPRPAAKPIGSSRPPPSARAAPVLAPAPAALAVQREPDAGVTAPPPETSAPRRPARSARRRPLQNDEAASSAPVTEPAVRELPATRVRLDVSEF